MKPLAKHVLITTTVLLVGAAAGAAVFIASGTYNIAADDPHTAPVSWLLETLRERSMETRAAKLTVPDLSEERRIVEGAGNYNAMCVGCHLSPGMEATEISRGLYPSPPNLSREAVEPEHAFWAIKHGIKASGMPAWGKSMNDDAAWNMTAFLVRLPKMSAAQYEQLVASSGGHSHVGAEEGEAHHHEHGAAGSDSEHERHDHDAETEAAPAGRDGGEPVAAGESAAKSATTTHVHADGRSHTHTTRSRSK